MIMAVVVAVSMLDVVRMIVSMGMAMTVIVVAVAVAVTMVAEDEEVDGIDQNTHHGQNEHHCTRDDTEKIHLSTPVNTWT